VRADLAWYARRPEGFFAWYARRLGDGFSSSLPGESERDSTLHLAAHDHTTGYKQAQRPAHVISADT
jgi:hypothetical protein